MSPIDRKPALAGGAAAEAGAAPRRPTPCLVDPVTRCPILGISQVMSQIHGAAVLVHGPKGCVFPAYEATLADRLAFNYTEMCERSTIFGGEDALREKLLDTYYDNLPSVIALVTTCSSEIIGDDVRGIASVCDLPVPVLRMEGAGFQRDNWLGVDHAMSQIVKERTKQVRRKELVLDGSINLVSHVGASPSWKDEVLALEQELAILGRPVRRLFCDNVLADFDAAPNAAVNVLISPHVGQELARHLEQRYGTPCVAPGLPVGLEQTVRWIGAVADRLGVNVAAELDRKADATRTRFREGLGRVNTFRPLESLRTLAAAVVADPAAALAYHHFLVHELRMEPRLVVLKSPPAPAADLARLAEAHPRTRFVELLDYVKVREAIREARPELLLGNDIEYQYSRQEADSLYVNVTYPGARRVRMRPRPYLGFTGTLHLAEDLLNAVIDRNA